MSESSIITKIQSVLIRRIGRTSEYANTRTASCGSATIEKPINHKGALWRNIKSPTMTSDCKSSAKLAKRLNSRSTTTLQQHKVNSLIKRAGRVTASKDRVQPKEYVRALGEIVTPMNI